MTKCLPDGDTEPVDKPTSAPPEPVSACVKSQTVNWFTSYISERGLHELHHTDAHFYPVISHMRPSVTKHPPCCGSIISRVKKRLVNAAALSESPARSESFGWVKGQRILNHWNLNCAGSRFLLVSAWQLKLRWFHQFSWDFNSFYSTFDITLKPPPKKTTSDKAPKGQNTVSDLFTPKPTETHTTTHKHRLPNARRADLFTPLNIPSEEEGQQILPLHLCGLMFARCSLPFNRFFSSTPGCQH